MPYHVTRCIIYISNKVEYFDKELNYKYSTIAVILNKVFMKRKFLLHYVKELLKLQYKFFRSFALQRLVDEIFQFEFFCPLIRWHFA